MKGGSKSPKPFRGSLRTRLTATAGPAAAKMNGLRRAVAQQRGNRRTAGCSA